MSAAPAKASRSARIARRLAVLAAHLRRRLGIRRGLSVDGVYYKELSSESLTRALSRQGAGYKDFRVTFPDRTKVVIRCSREQVYGDLMGSIGIERLEPLLPVVRPGGRILEFDAGTGYRAFWLSFVVGPSGGVVAISQNPRHAEFAAKRYPRANVSFETAEGFALAGETDGAFDAVVALAMPGSDDERRTLLHELWRLTAPGGALLVGIDTDALVADLAEAEAAELKFFDSPQGRDAMLTKPREDPPNRSEPRRSRDPSP